MSRPEPPANAVTMGFSDADMMGRGGKTGSGKLSSESQANVERRERLRKLAMETVDLNKDPYFLRNHLGTDKPCCQFEHN